MAEAIDILAVGAHPDDVEIACGGTLAQLAWQGYRVGIVDLTDGEPTPGSPGPEVRLAEAQRAAETLGMAMRITLDLPNRRLFDSFESRCKLAAQFRRHRPRLVIGLGGKTPSASPDHQQAAAIIEAAIFYAKLTKWDEHFEGTAPCEMPTLLHCFLAFRSPLPLQENLLAVDISDTLETKIAAIRCYASQFPPEKQRHLDAVRAVAMQQGVAAGFAAAEMLGSVAPLGTRDLMGALFGAQLPLRQKI